MVGMVVVDDRATLLTVCGGGYGKRTDFKEYRRTGRGGKGIINIKASRRNGRVIGLRDVLPEDELMLITGEGKIIRLPVSEIRVIGRNTPGVRLIGRPGTSPTASSSAGPGEARSGLAAQHGQCRLDVARTAISTPGRPEGNRVSWTFGTDRTGNPHGGARKRPIVSPSAALAGLRAVMHR